MAVNYREYLSIRGIFLLVLGMAGSVIGNHVLKTGVQSEAAFFHSMVLYMVCFFLILLGVIVWAFDIIRAGIRKREKESSDDDTHLRQKTYLLEMNILKRALTGTVLLGLVVFGVQYSQNIWLQAVFYCGVPITAFVLYLLIKST
jgi:uncharacterized membrane protein